LQSRLSKHDCTKISTAIQESLLDTSKQFICNDFYNQLSGVAGNVWPRGLKRHISAKEWSRSRKA